jgi:ferredoxin
MINNINNERGYRVVCGIDNSCSSCRGRITRKFREREKERERERERES